MTILCVPIVIVLLWPAPMPLACKNIGDLCSSNAECCSGHCYIDKNPRTPPRPNCHAKPPPREE